MQKNNKSALSVKNTGNCWENIIEYNHDNEKTTTARNVGIDIN